MEPLTPTDPAWIGAYALLARLGAGGMGQVYLGRSPGGRLVAVKVVREEITGHPEALARFRREARTVRAVRSAYTANLIDASLEAAPYWLATEYVAGPTLGRAVGRRGPLPARTCRRLAAALAEGLASVHAYGVTHRDLKPQNVILGAQGPQLIDFGIAHGVGATDLTRDGQAPGTPGYTAPEVLLGGSTGPAADVFALGATLAYAATGRPPFGSGAAATVGYRAVYEGVDVAGVEPGLAALIEACMAKDPAARPEPAEVIRRCGVREALVDDPVYGELGALGERVPPHGLRTGDAGNPYVPPPSSSGRPRTAPVAEASPQVPGSHGAEVSAEAVTSVGVPGPRDAEAAPDAVTPRGATEPPGATEALDAAEVPAVTAARRRWGARMRGGAGVVVGAGLCLVVWTLLPFGAGAGHGAGGGASGSVGGPGGATGAPPDAQGGQPSGAATSRRGGGGPAAYIESDRVSRHRWTGSPDPALAAQGVGQCDQVPEEQPPGAGFVTSVSTTSHNGVPGTSATIRMRVEYAGGKPSGPDPYYVAVAVKPPHDVDPETGRPLPGDNRSVGYTSRPADLHATARPGADVTLTYPDDFTLHAAGKKRPAVPLAGDPGGWTVVFYHVEDDPAKYAGIACSGFQVG
ncbi:hypothetical protein AMK16_31420 [Streptomyces sp. CB00455]|uniref:serine/threonine-protein kinase n=1 Tax=Streptomyces sp. CB00455 TaxID=1703927 RepID=UPI000939AA56|nr:serine/threonine-protein kinase [Streptomyces sp. CB00455]OKK13050.1 hypothetical protein AMK16_31420 [Streptomyces sp. CB00455]